MPLNLFGSIMLGIFTNIDNLGVGVAYGIKKIRIGMMSSLLIAFFNASGTFISMTAGETISQFLSMTTASYIGNGIIILIGVWGFVNTFGFTGSDSKITANDMRQEICQLEHITRHPEILDEDASGHINMKECLPLAFALTISNLGTGIGAGIAGYDIGFLVFVMFIFSILGISIGHFLGKAFFMALPGRWPGVVSGLLLIGLGMYEVLL